METNTKIPTTIEQLIHVTLAEIQGVRECAVTELCEAGAADTLRSHGRR
jgi:hypothetical protein